MLRPKKVLWKNLAKKVAVVSKAKGAVRCGGLPCVLQRGPTSPLIPLTISGHFTHTTISHSPTHPTIPWWWPGLPQVPQGGSTTPPGPPTPLLTWGPAGGVERRNISKMWHCLLSGCLGWLTDWPGGAHNERACRAAAYCHRVIHIWLSGKTKLPTCPIRTTRSFFSHQSRCIFLQPHLSPPFKITNYEMKMGGGG